MSSPLLLLLLGYLSGSVPFGVLVTRWLRGVDVRQGGSGNIGATNVTRVAGKKLGAVVLLLDALKGLVPVVLVKAFGEPFGLGDSTVALAGLAAFLGHLYPVFFGFKGGKGVATALGVLLGISGWLGLATALTWVIVAVFFRYSSLAALVASVFAPVYYVLCSGIVWDAETPITAAIVVMAILLVWRHRENIQRLIAGKESRLGQKKTEGSKPAEGAARKSGKSKHR